MSEENTSQSSQNTNNDQMSQEELTILLQTTSKQLEEIYQQLNNNNLQNLPNQETVELFMKSAELAKNSLDEMSSSRISNTPKIKEGITLDNVPITERKSDQTQQEDPESNLIEESPVIDRASPHSHSVKTFWKGLFAKTWVVPSIAAVIIIGIVSTSVLFFTQSSPVRDIVQNPTNFSQPNVVETPFQIESPELPKPVEIAPPPQLKLTPEQSLIASIQQEVTDLTNQYPVGLIGTIEADFLKSRLIVTMGEQWYELPKKRQDTLANTILNRTQNLDFKKLEILDKEGTLIARSPVVGNEIIILQR